MRFPLAIPIDHVFAFLGESIYAMLELCMDYRRHEFCNCYLSLIA